MSMTKSNPLVAWTAGLLISYWVFAAVMPGQWMNAFVSASLTVAGATVLSTVVGEAYRIIRAGVIGPGQLAVLGITLIAAGSLYSGIFGISWAIAGYPKHWVGNAISSYGKALHIMGFALVYLSPDATTRGIKRPNMAVILLGVALVALLAFILGTRFPGF